MDNKGAEIRRKKNNRWIKSNRNFYLTKLVKGGNNMGKASKKLVGSQGYKSQKTQKFHNANLYSKQASAVFRRHFLSLDGSIDSLNPLTPIPTGESEPIAVSDLLPSNV
jgi:hypothetical protein